MLLGCHHINQQSGKSHGQYTHRPTTTHSPFWCVVGSGPRVRKQSLLLLGVRKPALISDSNYPRAVKLDLVFVIVPTLQSPSQQLGHCCGWPKSLLHCPNSTASRPADQVELSLPFSGCSCLLPVNLGLLAYSCAARTTTFCPRPSYGFFGPG